MKDLKIYASCIEQEAIDQIDRLLAQPAFESCKVRVMPDVHAGAGCVIGFTADLGDKVIPNVVGVDIGCGMLVVELGKIDIDFVKLDRIIRERVPSGMNVREGRIAPYPPMHELHCFRNLNDTKRLERSIGTLGGGNHFIEIDVDDEENKYLIIHTGSRNLGKQVADHYQNLAWELAQGNGDLFKAQAELIARYKAEGRKQEIQSAINRLHREFEAKQPCIPKDLAYLAGDYRTMYLHDMDICQNYATLNRISIASEITTAMDWGIVSCFETVHNYIDLESNIVRKGAVSAKKGERLIIPMNMRDGSLICVGKGNEDWNCSAPHGAGRLMSRTKARETLSMNMFAYEMRGIYSTSVSQETLDEAPMAYKPMSEIIPHLEPTVEIERIIKPIYNFKASE